MAAKKTTKFPLYWIIVQDFPDGIGYLATLDELKTLYQNGLSGGMDLFDKTTGKKVMDFEDVLVSDKYLKTSLKEGYGQVSDFSGCHSNLGTEFSISVRRIDSMQELEDAITWKDYDAQKDQLLPRRTLVYPDFVQDGLRLKTPVTMMLGTTKFCKLLDQDEPNDLLLKAIEELEILDDFEFNKEDPHRSMNLADDRFSENELEYTFDSDEFNVLSKNDYELLGLDNPNADSSDREMYGGYTAYEIAREMKEKGGTISESDYWFILDDAYISDPLDQKYHAKYAPPGVYEGENGAYVKPFGNEVGVYHITMDDEKEEERE